MSLAIALLTVSDTRTAADDRSGDALAERLQAAGHRLHERCLVPDDRYRIRAELSRWIADPAVQVVISSPTGSRPSGCRRRTRRLGVWRRRRIWWSG